MTARGTVSVDRTALSLSSLTIDTEGFGTYYVDKAGLGRVGVLPRETFAADSPWVHGKVRTSVVLEETSLVLAVRVQSTSAAALNTAVSALQTALWQFIYPLTVTLDGVAKVWTAYPATIGAVDGLVKFEAATNFFEDLSISIPVYPVSA